MSLRIETVRTEGLGDNTFVLAYQGLALIVDPQRDIDRFQSILDELRVEARYILETHLHNDYVSGGKDLAEMTGAELVLPAGAAPVFRHTPAFHLEPLSMGDLTIRPLHTPGHTPEHVSYVIEIEGRDHAVFSGGSLLVGSAGRSDLLGDDRADSLARLQYRSVNRLAALDDDVELLPTHGAGSFCTTTGASLLTSTIGAEKKSSPVLAYEDEDSFVKGQLSGLLRYPTYYSHMGPLNVTGLDRADLTAPVVERPVPGTTVVDARPRERVAKGHLEGALAIELESSFGTWVGWLTPHNTPLTLVVDEDQDVEEAMRQLVRIGYDDVRGIVRTDSSSFTETFGLVDLDEFAEAVADGAQILDVRAPNEWETGVIDGSELVYLPDLSQAALDDLDPDEPVWVLCASGYRANTAASILSRRGYKPVALRSKGATELLQLTSKST